MAYDINPAIRGVPISQQAVKCMDLPYLLVVTGRPGAGKTTFAKELSNEFCMPMISRDQIKEGYVHTFGKRHSELPEGANKAATDVFFATLTGLLENKVSVIAEAAFQHGVWATGLKQFMGKARIYLLVCQVDDEVALNRFVRRGLDNPLREYFHGDKGVDMTMNPYEEPRLDVPTFHVDTSGTYSPSIKELRKKILGGTCTDRYKLT
ncbi:MAG: AAA family ATPase [Bacillota bacterium]|jgi:adenylate kinase family enzyme|nr:AAA family ATPase [Bacillota bacterium]